MADEREVLVEVKNLEVTYGSGRKAYKAVSNANFTIYKGETFGLVGESGCGKSITTLAIMGLTDDDEHLSGEVLWEGRDLLKMSKKEWFGLRGTDIAMVYQDALSSLNPSMLISAQMKQLTKRGGTRSAEELLELVGLARELPA